MERFGRTREVQAHPAGQGRLGLGRLDDHRRERGPAARGVRGERGQARKGDRHHRRLEEGGARREVRRHVVGPHRREGPRGHASRAGQQLVGGRGQPEGAHARDRAPGPGEGGAEGPRGPAPDDPGGDEDGAQGGGAEGRRDNQGQLLGGREGRHGFGARRDW